MLTIFCIFRHNETLIFSCVSNSEKSILVFARSGWHLAVDDQKVILQDIDELQSEGGLTRSPFRPQFHVETSSLWRAVKMQIHLLKNRQISLRQ